MTSDRFTVDGELRNEAGLHAVWRLPRATPSAEDVAVLHCLAYGRVRVGDLGLRAEIMEVQEIVLHPDVSEAVLEAVRLRYPACRVRKARKRMLVMNGDGSYGMTVNGKRHGRWVWPDGRVGHYRYGQRHGRWTWPNGCVGHYHDGKKHGLWTWPDGRVERYRNDNRHGRWTYPGGGIEHYRNGKEHGRWVWPDGRVGHYRDGKKHDRWVYPDGRVEVYNTGKLVRYIKPAVSAS